MLLRFNLSQSEIITRRSPNENNFNWHQSQTAPEASREKPEKWNAENRKLNEINNKSKKLRNCLSPAVLERPTIDIVSDGADQTSSGILLQNET